MVSHEEKRLSRINTIKRTIEEAKNKGVEINKEKLIIECCNEWGSTRRTILEYLKVSGFEKNE